jgi:hypothetical protein
MPRPFLLSVLFLHASFASPAAEVPRPEHPEPMAVREHWANLNGRWQFRFDADNRGEEEQWFQGQAKGFDRQIIVPFGWESELSGIQERSAAPQIGWYRRSFAVPKDFPKDARIWLRFGAVDHEATVWVNGLKVAHHEGGYTPFEVDITEALKADGENGLVVRAFDPTDPGLPTGKQVGWYTPTSGIWQTVWLESRPKTYISDFVIITDPKTMTFKLSVAGTVKDATYTLEARIRFPGGGETSVSQGLAAASDRLETELRRGIAGLTAWTPETPVLYTTTLALRDRAGKLLDSVETYFGVRTMTRGRYGDEPFERVLLNGRPIYLRGALDQSFNPKGIYTAPSDEFLKRDIELAKSTGTNFLRIHIKPDEPRRLYWADKLGMLIMEDMPNTWQQNPRARQAWEATMREVVTRDRNHPSIFAWVDFNETWGLGRPDQYKADKDTQDWVERMVVETRKLDPTRLVEDNSPCNYDHVSGTDLNSWHFYIDDHDVAKRHVDDVVAKSEPGSPFNYCPGKTMNTAPLINSEYGAVSAGGGDRDISWGFRDLTTLLRKQAKIQGYIYTELSDIEWEHNGFFNYDRSPKEFGYGAFVPGMTVADLQGADFIGYDTPPAIVTKPGELIAVPLFVSHYSERRDPPTLKWWISGYDDEGERVEMEPRERAVQWVPFGVKEQKRIAFRMNTTFVGAMALTLEDKPGHRIAANFVNLVVKRERPQARLERSGDHLATVRFSPGDFARETWSGPSGGTGNKVYGQGPGVFLYRLRLPASVVKAKPESVMILLEASAKAGREKVDWPNRKNAQDYPQTDTKKWPSTLEVAINGEVVARTDLPDDPADARGVLSHLGQIEHGSYGELVRLESPLPDSAKADLAAGKPLILSLGVPNDVPKDGGLCLYGAETGAYPFDPTLLIATQAALPADLGAKPDAPVAIETVAARRVALLRAGDSNQGIPSVWLYTTSDPGPGWAEPGFAIEGWRKGQAGFGTAHTPALQERTLWDTPAIWLRATVDLPKLASSDALSLHLFHDEDVALFVNGKSLLRERGYVTSYRDIPLDESQKGLFRTGPNTIAVKCTQTGGGQGIDVGLSLTRGE